MPALGYKPILQFLHSSRVIDKIDQYGIASTPVAHAREILSREVNFQNYFTPAQKHLVQRVGVTTAAVSVLASILTTFWFCRMRKRLRHSLIMFLIMGGMLRSLWLLIIASVALKQGGLDSSSVMCQVSGWLVQFGTVMNDWAALALAVHGSIQILRPSVNTIRSADVMFIYRHYVYGALIVIPVLFSSLVYTVEGGQYTAAGPFCMLPVRPHWYRLALAWIPRYIISIIILALAVIVYIHVKNAYRNSGRKTSGWRTLPTIMGRGESTLESNSVFDASFSLANAQSDFRRPIRGSRDELNLFDTRSSPRRPSAFSLIPTASEQLQSLGSPADAPYRSNRRSSTISISPSNHGTAFRTQLLDTEFRETEGAESLPAQPRQASVRPSLDRISSRFSSISNRTGSLRGNKPSTSGRFPSLRMNRAMSTPGILRHQRAAIRRHLRMTFIYPLVYILIWLVPFIYHCTQYDDSSLDDTVELAAASTFFVTLMGGIDCAIFVYREKPWRHISGNEGGGFWGSFCFWRGSASGGRNSASSNDIKGKRKSVWRAVARDDSYASDGEATTSRSIDEERGNFKILNAESGASRRNSKVAPPHRPTLATIASSQDEVLHVQEYPLAGRRTDNISSPFARTAVRTPGSVSRYSKTMLKRLQKSCDASLNLQDKRSDAEKINSECARHRLEVEFEDRRAAGLQGRGSWNLLERSATAVPVNERNWWDSVRKESLDWSHGPSRRATAAGISPGRACSDTSTTPSPHAGTGGGDHVGIVLDGVTRNLEKTVDAERKEGVQELQGTRSSGSENNLKLESTLGNATPPDTRTEKDG